MAAASALSADWKVALIIEQFVATRGAAEHLAVWVANALAKGGYEVHVV